MAGWRRERGREDRVSMMTWVPQSCTLPKMEQPLRVAEFDALFASAVRSAERTSRTELWMYLPGGADVVATARDVIERETECCSFFTFDLRASAAGTELGVRVPDSQVAVLDAMQARAEAARMGLSA